MLADIKLIPNPPAHVEIKNMKTSEPSLVNSSIQISHSSKDVLPSSLK